MPIASGLLARVVARDPSAFVTIVQIHYARVRRMVVRFLNNAADAEEVAQETFLKLWSEASTIRDEGSLQAWLSRVASNLAFDRLRHTKTLAACGIKDCLDAADESDRELRRRAVSGEIEEAMAYLPDRQRHAVLLVHFEGLDQKTAAAAMAISVEALESLLARSKRSLRNCLSDRWQDLLAEMDGL